MDAKKSDDLNILTFQQISNFASNLSRNVVNGPNMEECDERILKFQPIPKILFLKIAHAGAGAGSKTRISWFSYFFVVQACH